MNHGIFRGKLVHTPILGLSKTGIKKLLLTNSFGKLIDNPPSSGAAGTGEQIEAGMAAVLY